MDTIKINKNKTKMIAHRGLSKIEKENTIPAFVAAGSRSYFGLECDIHKTIDGHYVVIHDDDTERVSEKKLIISEATLDELTNIDLLDVTSTTTKSYYKIPKLVDYLECAIRYQKKSVIEFKNQFPEEDIKEVLAIITDLDYLSNTIFISFYPENLITLRKLLPNHKLQFLTSKYSLEVLELCKKYHFDLDISHPNVTKELVDSFHNEDLEVNVWTVDDEKTANHLVELGVDYLTTNILE